MADLPAALVVAPAVAALPGITASCDALPVVVWPPADSASKVRQTPMLAGQRVRNFMMISTQMREVSD
jgi:hypothetical protein